MLALPTTIPSCAWATQDPLLQAFHDNEWGEPVTEAVILFEYLLLHTFQIGFNLPVVLRRREAFRELLVNFEPERLVRFTDDDVEELLLDPRILRSRHKLRAAVQNARAWLQLQRQLGGENHLLSFFYDFVGGQPLDNQRQSEIQMPGSTPASVAMSKELKRRGFVMTGPATCYNLMQTAGLVNDHLVSCPQHRKCQALASSGTPLG
ncbi:DNA-3-methyladenine glycosylase I [Hymenobacter sp. BT186]|uniref:DNA-3-methyladenine glycosylase I n=1 Tax=Hymenobacter telluris TaxID=2816474 RepID=A0A939EYA5_9BACT|nr:DNA-3-methyladenine glycosylase I [Hymenobacter telluris]MBO0359434.1 DNA-3-methyladenine glycosylase I [Hymenobacter telluris]MBW3375460.1 DNA-3-methyladenine glycosylase I [Hymenobacter norwichensis]